MSTVTTATPATPADPSSTHAATGPGDRRLSRFNTLLLREWMQHHRGWLALMLAPPLLMLLVLPFGSVQFEPGELGPLPPLTLMMITMAAVPAFVLAITALTLVFQVAGLARRDRQDRSIEFWLSLPASHSASVGATALAHLVLVPLLAVVVGALFSTLIGFGLVWKLFGLAAALDLPWPSLAAAGAAGLVRLLLGVVLASAWLMPITLTLMAAAAWLKRWGVALLAIGLSFGHKALATLYGITAIGDTMQGLLVNARQALIHDQPPRVRGGDATLAALGDAPAWFLHDGLAALRDLAQPLFVFALAAGALAFALLVLRRRRNG